MGGSATVRQSPGGSEKSAFIGLRAGQWRPRHVSALGGDKFEDLFREGKSVRYHVELDKNGEPQLSSFGATAGKSIGTTIAHAVFGVRATTHCLAVSLPN